MKKILVLINLIILSAYSASGLMLKLSEQELALSAEKIVHGRVIKKESFWNKDKNIIFTRVIVRKSELLKGEDAGDEVELIIPGGKIGLWELRVSDMAVFQENEEVLLFIQKDRFGNNNTVGAYQGKYALSRDSDNQLSARSDALKMRIKKIIKAQGQ